MNLQNQLIELAEKFNLKEQALKYATQAIDSCIEEDKGIGIDSLEGNKKSDLIFEFGSIQLVVDKTDQPILKTVVKIYSKKFYDPDCDVPIGHYTELTSLNGEHLDEFLNLDWSPINFNIHFYIERISNVTPANYYWRNKPEYTFASYVNNSIVLIQGRQFDGAVVFIKRSLEYILNPNHKELLKEYREECIKYFTYAYYFIKRNELVNFERLAKYGIETKLKDIRKKTK